MIRYFKGNLLDSGCDVIAHQVNLQGVMGGGLALQIATRYPSIEKFYKAVVQSYKNLLGHFYGCKAIEDNRTILVSKKVFIANCFTQDQKFNTDYVALRKCFEELKEWCTQFYEVPIKTIGVPKNYGCGIANGDWSKVEAIFKELFENEESLELQVWEL